MLERRHGPFFGPGSGRHMVFSSEKPEKPLETLKVLLSYIGRYRLSIFIVLLCIVGTSALSIISPYLIGKAVDVYIMPKNLTGFGRFVAMMFTIYLFNSLLLYVQSFTMADISQNLGFQLRKEMFDSIHCLPLSFLDKKQIGDIMSRVVNDTDTICMTVGTSITQFISGVIMLIGTVSMMIFLSPVLTMFSFILIPLMALITKIISSRTRNYFFQQQTKLGQVNGIIQENITGWKIVKVFGKEKDELEKFEKTNSQLRDCGIMAQQFSGILPPMINFLNNISFAIIGGIGGALTIKKIITIGTIVSFINYVRQFTRPVNELANQYNMIQAAIASAERVFEITEAEKEKEQQHHIQIKDIKGKVEFKNVWFSYEKGKYVLKNINFSVEPGQTVAIVGPTGVGKTTLVNLMTRMYEIDKGQILIDGIDIKNIKKTDLRKIIKVVLQDTYLFAETIKENIRYGKLDATDQQIINACKIANAENFIQYLPEKYETVLIDGGQSLSQGQRQLLSIARTILAEPKILVLDEATSNIDTKTEKDIQQSMLKLMEGKTCFVIAHRLNTIKNADIIFVMNEGEIIEKGTHKQLMENKGFHYHLYSSQFGEIAISNG